MQNIHVSFIGLNTLRNFFEVFYNFLLLNKEYKISVLSLRRKANLCTFLRMHVMKLIRYSVIDVQSVGTIQPLIIFCMQPNIALL